MLRIIFTVFLLGFMGQVLASFSSERAAVVNKAFPALEKECNDIVAGFTKETLKRLVNATEKGYRRVLVSLPKDLERCGHDRDQLSYITAVLCNEENDLVVFCDGEETVDIGTKEQPFYVIPMSVEIKLTKSDDALICNCRAAPLRLPRGRTD